jgi:hypothetical protein
MALGIFPCALRPSLGAAGLLLFLSTNLFVIDWHLSLASLATGVVLSAAGLLSGLFYSGPFCGLFFGPAAAASSTASLSLRVGLLGPPTSFFVCGGIGTPATGFGARLHTRIHTRICFISFISFEDAPEQGREG